MPRHLFLTGQKRVGKSTLLHTLLADAGGPVSGFYTVRSVEIFQGRPSVHMLCAATGREPTEENLLFLCGIHDPHAPERFDRLGTAALAVPGRLIVMDELGPHEARADVFCRRVMELLDGDVPVLGVLQQSDSPFLQAVARHPRVEVVEVTEENRDALADTLRDRWS